MRLFFAALKRHGTLEAAEVEAMCATLERHLLLPGAQQRRTVVTPSPRTLVIGVSDDDEEPAIELEGSKTLFPCGSLWQPAEFDALAPSAAFADDVSRLSGRVSALLVAGSRFAINTPIARIDSVFEAESPDFWLWGNQASAVSALRDGAPRLAAGNLMTLINAGFFGNDLTPYEGVRALPPLTTILVDGDRVTRTTTPLASLKSDGRPAEQTIEACADAYLASLAPLAGADQPIRLYLSGGMDSRLLLAGAARAGLPVTCWTMARRERNRADVWVAGQVAARAGLPQTVVDDSSRSVADPTGDRFDLLDMTATLLRASDGMLTSLDPVDRDILFPPCVSLTGMGGETLRGGYAEKLSRIDKARVSQHFTALWCGFPDLFRPEAREEQRAIGATFVADQLERLGPHEAMDVMYTYYRCGRWAAAWARGAGNAVQPFLDNRFSREVLALSARVKRTHVLYRELIRRLCPELDDLPLAGKFWHGTAAEERERLRGLHPEAYPADTAAAAAPAPAPAARRGFWSSLAGRFRRGAPRSATVRGVAPPVADHIRDYLVREDRLAALGDVLDLDAAARFLRDPPADNHRANRFYLGAYSAAVLLCEDWRAATPPSRPFGIDRSPQAGARSAR